MKKIKKSSFVKKIMSYIIVLIFSTTLFMLFINKDSNNNNQNNSHNDNGSNNSNENIVISPIVIVSYKISNVTEKKFSIYCHLVNDNDNNITIEKEKMEFNFYEKDKLVYTFEYEIEKLEPYDEVSFDVVLDFNISKVDKYEVVIGEEKRVITPVIL